MEPVVRYAAREDLPRVNELRQQVSELHAAGRPDIFRPGFCEALQQHVYQLFDAPEFDVLVACVGETICGFAAVQYVDRPESAYLCARRFYHEDAQKFYEAVGFQTYRSHLELPLHRPEGSQKSYQVTMLSSCSFSAADILTSSAVSASPKMRAEL